MRAPALIAIASLITLGSALTVGSALQSATPTPSQMQHIIVSTMAAGTDPKSFEAQPKEYWRVGDEHGRIAEQPDNKQKIQKLLIINPPEYWDIELFSKQGRHLVYDKKSPVRFSIFSTLDESREKLRGLEYGKELRYFQENHATKTAKKESGAGVDEYTLPLDKYILVLDYDSKTNKPTQVSMSKDNRAVTIHYVAYETLPYKDSLFKPPTGIQVQTITSEQLRKKRDNVMEIMRRQMQMSGKTGALPLLPPTATSGTAKNNHQ